MDHRNHKKKLIISYKNLPDKAKELFKETYPEGYKDYLQKTIKPNGDAIFVVPLETDDTSYMVKFDVVYDTTFVEEEMDKENYNEDEETQGEATLVPLTEVSEKEEGTVNHNVVSLQHGAYDEMFEGLPEDKEEFEMADADLDKDYDEEDDGKDSYVDDDDDDDDEDLEPDDDELLGIETMLNAGVDENGMLRDEEALAESTGKKKKETRTEKAIRAIKNDKAKAAKATKSETTTKASKAAKETATTKAAKSESAAKAPKSAAKAAAPAKAPAKAPKAPAKVAAPTKAPAKATKAAAPAKASKAAAPAKAKTSTKKGK
ncbi:MAG: hypothetical protein K5864_08810 [Bacteroidales bacterium]|nr:hypothetical protein [Bacteroidales bacterium]